MLAVTMTTWNMRGKAKDIRAVETTVWLLDADAEVVSGESFCFHCLSVSLMLQQLQLTVTIV